MNDLAGPAPPWHAELALAFARRECDGRTALVERRHAGPLRVQRVLHPEASGCEALILHPPGGIAGGDSLAIRVALRAHAEALISTPGASKWYRSAGRRARQRVELQLDADATLEWLPQEAIVFREADAEQSLSLRIGRDARCLGWDLVQLGRGAAGEAWDRGTLRQTLTVARGDVPVWHEHALLDGADPALHAAARLAGRRVFGTLWAAAPALDADPEPALAAARDALAASRLQSGTDPAQALLCAAATWLAAPASLLLVRALGDDPEILRRTLEAAWSALRPIAIGRAARRPRIWAT
jgi:urease accessory protein